MHTRDTARALVAITLTAVVAGCTAREKAAPDASSSAPPAAATATAPAVVTVHASDYAFQGPDTIPSGMTTFHLVNDGPGFHHMVLVKLDSGKTFVDLQGALRHPGPFPHWAVPIGGPNAPDPHSESNATLDLSPGAYGLLCFVDVPGGVPHFAKGMSRALWVTPGTAQTATPLAANVTVTMSDYKFDIAGSVKAGRDTFAVQTQPGQPHELELIRLDPGKTAKDMVRWIGKMQGPPPGQAIGGAAVMAAGHPVYFTADLTPGTYLFVCFVPDAKDTKPHAAHGMVQTVSVT